MKKLFLLLIFVISSFAYNVTVSILPQKFIIDFISANKANVNVMVPKGASPATYSPKPHQLLTLKKSLVYFKIDVPFEKAWINKFTDINSNIKIVDFAKYIKKDKNPHIWLDPIFLIQEAKVVYKTLSQIDSKNKNIYYQNFLKFKQKCLNVNNKIKSLIKIKKFIIFHPNLYYFAKRYNITEIAIEKEGKEASIRYLLKIIKIAKQNNIKIIFTSPEFSKKSANFLANKIGAKVIDFSALDYNIFDNLLKVAKYLNGRN